MGKVHAEAVPAVQHERGVYRWSRRQLGSAAGGRLLGCSLFELPPGARDFPLHRHLGNEEAIFVLDGEGTLRQPGADEPLRAGDYVALPVGELGHQVVNTSDRPLRFLAISTMRAPDVMLYPEKQAFGVVAGSPPGGDPDARTFSGHFPLQESIPSRNLKSRTLVPRRVGATLAPAGPAGRDRAGAGGVLGDARPLP